VMKYSKHIPQDIEFEKFILTEQAAKIIEASGVTPNRVGFVSDNPVVQDIEKYIQGDHYTVYPMLDNIAQTNVVNTGSQDLDATFAGDMSADAALEAMAKTWQQLPSSQK
jgi:ABC-type glycerol-3-phosphate transport system substrate-binding protein